MRPFLHTFLLSAVLCLAAGSLLAQAGLRVVDLKCEYSVDPLGVDVPQPRLFWRLVSEENGQRQTAFRILVASSPEILEQDKGDLWNSGKITTDQTTHVPYAGERLRSSQQVFWKVRAWDRDGDAGEWSAPATWTMGILHHDQWKGKWIGAPARHESVLLRHEFTLKKPLRRAVIHISGLGHYELTLNGRRVGEDLLTPGWTNYDETTLYDTYDITDLLESDGNAVGVLLGNGMYHVERRNRFAKFEGSFGPKRLIAQIHLEYADGTTGILGTNEQWLTRPGPITYSSIYGGEDFDSRRIPLNWDRSGFDPLGWLPAVPMVTERKDTLKGHSVAAHPIRRIEVRDPAEVRKLAGPGAVLFDFGQNTSYMPLLTVSGPAGSRVRLLPGELIYPDGYITRSSMGGIHRGFSWWEYVKSTDGEETWFPDFFYIGSRYMQSQAIPAVAGGERPVVESLKGVVVHSSADPLGAFKTSNPLLNRIRDLVRWAQRSNMVSVLTDCPHREKLGWLEQYHLNGPGIRYEFDVAKIFTKGMNDMADSQTGEGLVPNIAPEFTEFGGTFRAAAEWGAAFILVPWQQYLFSGDLALVRRHYPDMKRYFSYLESRAVDDILSEGLGDWYDLGPRRPGRAQLTFPPLTATAFFQHDAAMLARMAALLGEDIDAAHFSRRAEEIRRRFNDEFFDEEGGFYGRNSQAANAIPLVFGLVEPADRSRVFASLVRNVVENEYRMTAGDVGFRFLIQALSDGGRDDIVYRMINHQRNPGYGYQLKMGATALTEAWDASRSSSNNHFMLGHIMEWFYEDLLGIGTMEEFPGFKRVRIRPRPVGDLAWVEGSHDSLHGPVAVRWERDGNLFRLKVTIPANTSAEIWLPTDRPDSVNLNAMPLAQAEVLEDILLVEGSTLVTVPSGSHEFTVQEPRIVGN